MGSRNKDVNIHTESHGVSWYFLSVFLTAIALLTLVFYFVYQSESDNTRKILLTEERHFAGSLAETATDYLNTTVTDILHALTKY